MSHLFIQPSLPGSLLKRPKPLFPTNIMLTVFTLVYSLAAVNFCLFLVGTVQCARIFAYQASIKGTEGALKSMEGDIVDAAKSVEKKIERKL
jgi:ABC-type proline/glycine betaine transport system permease subunit